MSLCCCFQHVKNPIKTKTQEHVYSILYVYDVEEYVVCLRVSLKPVLGDIIHL